ncbi:MAG: EamA/RhaT family transporter, partial [Bacteroidota bacterium]
MIYLLLSIVFSVITVSFFKLFEKYGVHTISAIVLNYISCVRLGNISGEYAVSLSPFYNEPWFLDTLVLGALFISIFMSIGLTAQKLGVSVSMLAAKLSVVVPVCVAFFLYDETITPLKLTGILLSMVAVYLI